MTTNNDNISNEPDEASDPMDTMVICYHTDEEIRVGDCEVWFATETDRRHFLHQSGEGAWYRIDMNAVIQAHLDGSQLVRFVSYNYADDYLYCEQCQAMTHYQDSSTVGRYGSTRVCESCVAEYYSWCERCDMYYEGSMCEFCEESGGGLIHDYGYRPRPEFNIMRPDGTPRRTHSEPNRTVVTGFELEMEADHCSITKGAELATSLFDPVCYLKHDGSLSNGFEMVSHPMSLSYFRQHFPSDKLRDLSKLGMRSAQTSSCGLHVHMNKGFFTGRESALYRLLSLFYYNAEMWKAVAGRSNSSYANWSSNEPEYMFDYTMRFARREAIHNDRYVPVNLLPSRTIELRFFKGTLRPETFMARIEAVHAAAQYAVATQNNINIKKSHDWGLFRQWTADNGFSAFDDYAKAKGV